MIDEARALAERDYPWALARGSRLTHQQRTDIVAGRRHTATPRRSPPTSPDLAFQAPYTAAANHHLRSDLGYASDLPYEILTDRVHPWSYTEFEGRGVTVVDELDTALRANPFLKVHVSLGYYDGATPFAAAENVFSSMDLPDALRDNISYSYYPAGHMMYLHEESRVQQSRDLADFIAATVAH